MRARVGRGRKRSMASSGCSDLRGMPSRDLPWNEGEWVGWVGGLGCSGQKAVRGL